MEFIERLNTPRTLFAALAFIFAVNGSLLLYRYQYYEPPDWRPPSWSWNEPDRQIPSWSWNANAQSPGRTTPGWRLLGYVHDLLAKPPTEDSPSATGASALTKVAVPQGLRGLVDEASRGDDDIRSLLGTLGLETPLALPSALTDSSPPAGDSAPTSANPASPTTPYQSDAAPTPESSSDNGGNGLTQTADQGYTESVGPSPSDTDTPSSTGHKPPPPSPPPPSSDEILENQQQTFDQVQAAEQQVGDQLPPALQPQYEQGLQAQEQAFDQFQAAEQQWFDRAQTANQPSHQQQQPDQQQSTPTKVDRLQTANQPSHQQQQPDQQQSTPTKEEGQ